MKDIDQAFELGRAMVDIGNGVGKNTVAVVTDMEQPLGNTIGNGIEVREAIELLQGEGSKDLLELCHYLGSYMLLLAEKVGSLDEGMEKIQEVIDNGKALDVFKSFVQSQGGDIKFIEQPELLHQTQDIYEYKALSEGYIHRLDAELLGKSALTLGAGRLDKSTKIDHKVGLQLEKKIGDYVNKGETVITVFYNDKDKLDGALELLQESVYISDAEKKPRKIIHGVVTENEEKRL